MTLIAIIIALTVLAALFAILATWIAAQGRDGEPAGCACFFLLVVLALCALSICNA